MTRIIKTWSDVLGWVGMVSIICTYALFAWGYMPMWLFLSMSIVNSSIMAFHMWERLSRPAMVLNVIFVAISLVGLARLLFK